MPATLPSYRVAAQGLCRWMDELGQVPMREASWDLFLVGYKNSVILGHGQFLQLDCAAELLCPRLRGKLCW